ncbi:Hsp70 family protein, partial [Escherichia coli]|nr:Hsp70 family protein [Escherichia coli]
GLSKEEIDRMIKDAEAHAEEDKNRREEAEVRNQADSLVHQTEKFIKDNEDKVPADVKEKVEAAITEVKTALAGTDIAAVKAAVEKLSTESRALGQAIYDAQAADSAAGDGAGQAQDGDVVDAEVVDEPTDQDKK